MCITYQLHIYVKINWVQKNIGAGGCAGTDQKVGLGSGFSFKMIDRPNPSNQQPRRQSPSQRLRGHEMFVNIFAKKKNYVKSFLLAYIRGPGRVV